MKRTPAMMILAGAMALVGCQDMGLEYNLPLDEAMERPPFELVATVMAPTDVADRQLIVDGRLWIPSGLPLTLASDELQPVGAADGATVYARSWDTPPYDELFTELPAGAPTDAAVFGPAEGTQYLSYAPVIGGARPSAGPVRSAEPAGH